MENTDDLFLGADVLLNLLVSLALMMATLHTLHHFYLILAP